MTCLLSQVQSRPGVLVFWAAVCDMLRVASKAVKGWSDETSREAVGAFRGTVLLLCRAPSCRGCLCEQLTSPFCFVAHHILSFSALPTYCPSFSALQCRDLGSLRPCPSSLSIGALCSRCPLLLVLPIPGV
jgi:hypothetical protein